MRSFEMKKSTKSAEMMETTMGKFLARDFRPSIQLRTSPRKKKSKLKKETKRLDDQTKTLLTQNRRRKQLDRVKRRISFPQDDHEERKSLLFIISPNNDENELTKEELAKWKCNLCCVNSSKRCALIFSPRSSRLTLQGIFSIEQISGPPASLHGFTFQLFNRYSIFNICSQSLFSIENSSAFSKTSFNDNQIVSLFQNYQIQVNQIDLCCELIRESAKIHHGVAIFYVEQLQTTWIESMRYFAQNDLANQWLFHQKKNSNCEPDDHQDENLKNTNVFQQLWTNMGAFKDSHSHSIVYSNEICSTTDKILDGLLNKNSLIVFVCGAKDSGKSTYLRYLINKCVSQTNVHPKISFLDCDIGQSEFTPSGSISLINNLTEPLFGPSASHLKKPMKSFYFGNIQVNDDEIMNYLNCVRLCFHSFRHEQTDLLFVNTMGWSSDNGLMIMKELIDLIQPNIVVQLRSSNPYFRHTMCDINPQWSMNAPVSTVYRQMHKIEMNSLFHQYDYYLLSTSIHQHNQHGKSSLARQSCLWSYFSQIESKELVMKSLIDYQDRIEIFQFQQISIGLLHRQIEAKHLLEVLNGSIVALCRIKSDMLYRPSNCCPALIDEHASLECLGFGFIRSIDMTRHEIHVIIPDRSLTKSMINGFVKGHDDCPDEFYLMSIDRWRGSMAPYVTGIINSAI